MLLIACPHCGPRAQEEFSYERTTDSVVTTEAAPDAAMTALFTRENPRGVAEEIWRHTYGCRGWMVFRRDRISHAISDIRPLGPEPLA